MGFSYGSRGKTYKLASPLYISIIEVNGKYSPIMSKLNPEFPNGSYIPNDIDKVPNEFISELS
jgi:hypothetical protein